MRWRSSQFLAVPVLLFAVFALVVLLFVSALALMQYHSPIAFFLLIHSTIRRMPGSSSRPFGWGDNYTVPPPNSSCSGAGE